MSKKQKKRTKIILTYESTEEYKEPDLGVSVRQVLGAKDICLTCPRRFLNFQQVGKVTVLANTKADEGSKAPGPNTFEGTAVCFHPERGAPLYGRPAPLEKDPIAEIDAVMEANLPVQLERLGIEA